MIFKLLQVNRETGEKATMLGGRKHAFASFPHKTHGIIGMYTILSAYWSSNSHFIGALFEFLTE